jgi:hypothetical protein
VISSNQHYPETQVSRVNQLASRKLIVRTKVEIKIKIKIKIWPEFPELPTTIVNNDDTPIRKRKGLTLEKGKSDEDNRTMILVIELSDFN